MKATDNDRILEINVFAWRNSYRHIFSDELLFKTRLATSHGGLFGHNTGHETYVYDDGIIKGYVMLDPCEDVDRLDCFEICELYIDPFMQRQGIGRAMVDFSEETADARGFNKICLWTLEKNTTARIFYEKLGYAVDGARKTIKEMGVHQVRYSKKI